MVCEKAERHNVEHIGQEEACRRDEKPMPETDVDDRKTNTLTVEIELRVESQSLITVHDAVATSVRKFHIAFVDVAFEII